MQFGLKAGQAESQDMMNELVEDWAKGRARVKTGGWAIRMAADKTELRSYRGRL